MDILEISPHAVADVTVHRDRRARDSKFQTLSTTPTLIYCSILYLSCRVLLINQSGKPVWSPREFRHTSILTTQHIEDGTVWSDMTNGRALVPWAYMNLQISSTFLYSCAGCQSSRWNSVAWLHVFLTDGHMACHVIRVTRLCFFSWFLQWGDLFVYRRVIVASTRKNQPLQRSPGKLRGWHGLCISKALLVL
jgi:hypothetical protein